MSSLNNPAHCVKTANDGLLYAYGRMNKCVELSLRNGFYEKVNVYTAEVDTGKRIQKFKLTSDALR